MALDPAALGDQVRGFLTGRALATLTTLRADGSPHVVPVGFTWDDETARAYVITDCDSVKARNAARGGRAVLCQVDGRHWVSLEGVISVHADAASVADAERRYTQRYRPPRPNPRRIVLCLAVDRVLGNVGGAGP